MRASKPGSRRGSEVPPFYDPMLAKMIVHGADRAEALAKMQAALAATRIAGIETNLDYLRQLASSTPCFADGRHDRRATSPPSPTAAPTIDVLEPGTQTTVQDWPGRIGYWDVGVPPSGPMDAPVASASPTGCRQRRRRGRRSRSRSPARRCVQHRRRDRAHRRATCRPTLDGVPRADVAAAFP